MEKVSEVKGQEAKDFQVIYNGLSSKISKVIDVGEYEETLSQLKIDS